VINVNHFFLQKEVIFLLNCVVTQLTYLSVFWVLDLSTFMSNCSQSWVYF